MNLSLIKLSANFENIIYILAFDPEIVEDALSERYFSKKKTAGQNFLEKIVQVPINLPKIPTTDLRDFCFGQVDKAIQLSGIALSEIEIQEFTRGFFTGVEIMLETPRMAIRYRNMLNFSLPLVKGEVNIAEFLLIEAVRAFYPDAYKIIKENRDAFTAVNLGSMTPIASEREEINNIVKKAFDGLTDDETNNLRRLITILFPRQQNTIYGPEWDKTWAEEKRIASQKYFDRYFTYSIPTGDVSDILVEDFITSLDSIDSEQLIKTLGQELSEQNAESFIAKLTQKIERISPEGKIKLAICLSLFGQRLPQPKGLFSGFTTPFSRAAILIARLIETLPESIDKVDLATKVVNVAEPISFAFTIVRWFKTKKVENEKDVISSDELQKINSTLAARIESLATKNDHFFVTYPDHAPVMIWFWRKYGSKENADKFMTEFLNEDIKNVHTLFNSVVPIAYPMDGSPPGKSEFERDQYNYLQSFVDPNFVYELLKKEYGAELESEEYPYDFGKPLDLRFARQFAWIHKKVLKENQASDAKNATENSS